MLYINVNSHVRCAAGKSDSFLVKVGVNQGSALSALLFILVMDTTTRDLQQKIPWTLLYADDIMLADNTREELQEQVEAWHACLSYISLCLNVQKTDCVGTCPSPGTVQAGIMQLVKSQSFHYLGSHLQCDSNLNEKVKTSVNAAWIICWTVMGTSLQQMDVHLLLYIYACVLNKLTTYLAIS